MTVAGREYRFETRPGVFSAGGPDAGTMLLLETVLPELKGHHTVLDLGTGAGLLGVIIAGALPRGSVWMVDVDIRATRLAQRNVEINGIANGHVVLGDVAEDLPSNLRFDVVVSNPPTHDGREVLRQFVEQSYRVLRPGGSLWCVINRILSTKDMIEGVFGNVEMRARQKGFIILAAYKEREGLK